MQLSNLSYKCDNCGASGKLLEQFFFCGGCAVDWMMTIGWQPAIGFLPLISRKWEDGRSPIRHRKVFYFIYVLFLSLSFCPSPSSISFNSQKFHRVVDLYDTQSCFTVKIHSETRRWSCGSLCSCESSRMWVDGGHHWKSSQRSHCIVTIFCKINNQMRLKSWKCTISYYKWQKKKKKPGVSVLSLRLNGTSRLVSADRPP